ncbi:MAG: 1-acyl-sn-glycerol-3-phosphate acyltransferase [Chloroflexi bacterium]|nr:1-acyl-sn-glycerol-3-phosphate acyltransferase [Chloroflexota bacterium]
MSTTVSPPDDVKFPEPVPGARTLCRLLMLLTCRLRVIGKENIPNEQFILTVNHLSYFDVPAVASQLSRESWIAAFTAKKYKGTWLEPFFHLGSPVWIEQDSPDRQALAHAIKLIKKGHNFGLAPEGHRSRTASLQTGREGAAFIINRTNVQVLPVAVYGTEKILKHPRPKVHIVFGKPYRLPEGRAKGPELTDYTHRIMCAIAALMPESYHGAYTNHPLLEEMAAVVRPDSL